mmetsp:Transcript_27950/g.60864  ORF Transcript_27950/g.60864 Transcript_27950/m.60864 type:complete len:661 (+) Transcript_27950:90-2072(+)
MKSSGHDGPRPRSVGSEKDGTPSTGSTTDGFDLDPFLTVLETRLRNPYSSFDLVRALDQYSTPSHASPAKDSDPTGAGRSVGQADNVQLLGRLFSRMAKSVKLRAIVGLMGLEPQPAPAPKGEQKEELNDARSVLDNALWKLLSSTECTDVDAAEGSHGFGGAHLAIEDEWVRVLSDVVRRVLFVASDIDSAADDRPDGASTSTGSASRTEAQAAPVVGLRLPCKGQTFSNAADKIVSEICTSATCSAQQVIRNGDPTVLFGPESFVLLPSAEVEKFVPEAVINPHFAVNMMSRAMKVDVESEFRRAEEEHLKDAEDLERKQRVGTQSGQTALVSAKVGGLSGVPTARSGLGANATGTTGKDIPKNGGRLGQDTASLFVRSKKPRTLGRGRMAPVGTGSGRGMGARAMGRGSAAAAVGRSLGVPTKKVMPRPKNVAKKRPTAFVASSKAVGGGQHAGAVSASTAKGRAAQAMGRSKMMMIDSAEVEALNREQKAREEKTNLPSSGKSRKRKIMEAAAAEEAAKKSKSAVSTSASASSSSDRNIRTSTDAPGHKAKEEKRTEMEPQPPGSSAASTSTEASQKDWQELLSKSNKLSEEDRSRVERFFTEKFNPTPDQMTYKMKLNEERKIEPGTGLTIKETLYLELDYSTFGYKKTRKTKKK